MLAQVALLAHKLGSTKVNFVSFETIPWIAEFEFNR